jgi:hypothetical protein
MNLHPTPEEQCQCEAVLSRILDCIREDRVIKLPSFDAEVPALFEGTVGPYRYQFEGEEDLLHLMVARSDGGPLSPAEGQSVASLLLSAVPSSLIWIKPGEFSQHFYLGHDELLRQSG